MAINSTSTPTVSGQYNYRPLIVIGIIVLLFVALPLLCGGIFWAGSSFVVGGPEETSSTITDYDNPAGFVVRSQQDRLECQQRQMSIVTIRSADGRTLGSQCRHGGQR